MSLLKAPENVPVWIDITRCKACDICVSACPAGVLSMRQEPSSTLGAIIDIIAPDSCIGCTDCEMHCPDFAIHVADKKADGIVFAKLTQKAEDRAQAIRNNNYRLPLNYTSTGNKIDEQ